MLGWLRAYAAATSTTASYTAVLDAATAGVSDKPARSTTAHLRWLADHLGADMLDAIIINTGPNAYRRPDGIGVVPLALLGP